MLAQAHGSPGISPAGRSPVVLHPNASHSLAPPYDTALARRHGPGSVTYPKPGHCQDRWVGAAPTQR
jgi:hypothetical protein